VPCKTAKATSATTSRIMTTSLQFLLEEYAS
jgi:hypothetical protein